MIQLASMLGHHASATRRTDPRRVPESTARLPSVTLSNCPGVEILGMRGAGGFRGHPQMKLACHASYHGANRPPFHPAPMSTPLLPARPPQAPARPLPTPELNASQPRSLPLGSQNTLDGMCSLRMPRVIHRPTNVNPSPTPASATIPPRDKIAPPVPSGRGGVPPLL